MLPIKQELTSSRASSRDSEQFGTTSEREEPNFPMQFHREVRYAARQAHRPYPSNPNILRRSRNDVGQPSYPNGEMPNQREENVIYDEVMRAQAEIKSECEGLRATRGRPRNPHEQFLCQIPDCGRPFVNKARLDRHLKSHQASGNMYCELCVLNGEPFPHAFKQKYNLFAHWRKACTYVRYGLQHVDVNYTVGDLKNSQLVKSADLEELVSKLKIVYEGHLSGNADESEQYVDHLLED